MAVKIDEETEKMCWLEGQNETLKRRSKHQILATQKTDLLDFFLVNPAKPRLQSDYMKWLLHEGKLGGNKKALLKFISESVHQGVLTRMQVEFPSESAETDQAARTILSWGPNFPHQDASILDLFTSVQSHTMIINARQSEHFEMLKCLVDFIRESGSQGVTTIEVGDFIMKELGKQDKDFLAKCVSRYCRDLENRGLVRIINTIDIDGMTLQKRMVYSKFTENTETSLIGKREPVKSEHVQPQTTPSSVAAADLSPHRVVTKSEARLLTRLTPRTSSDPHSLGEGFHFSKLSMEANIILNWKSPLANFQKGLTSNELKKMVMLHGYGSVATRESCRLMKKFPDYVKCTPVRVGKAFCLKYYWQVQEFEEHFKQREIKEHHHLVELSKRSRRDLLVPDTVRKKYQRKVDILSHERAALDRNTYYSTSAVALSEIVHLEMFVVLLNMTMRAISQTESLIDTESLEHYKVQSLVEKYGSVVMKGDLDSNKKIKDEYVRMNRFCGDFKQRRLVNMQSLYNMVFFLLSRNRECLKLEPNCTLNPRDVTKEYTLDFHVRIVFIWTFIRLRVYCSVSQIRKMITHCLQSETQSKISYQFALKLCKLLEFLGLTILAKVKLEKKHGNILPDKALKDRIKLGSPVRVKPGTFGTMDPDYQERFRQRIVIMDKFSNKNSEEVLGPEIARNVFGDHKHYFTASKPTGAMLKELHSGIRDGLLKLIKVFLPQTLYCDNEVKIRLLNGVSKAESPIAKMNLVRVSFQVLKTSFSNHGLTFAKMLTQSVSMLKSVKHSPPKRLTQNNTDHEAQDYQDSRDEEFVPKAYKTWVREKEHTFLDSILEDEIHDFSQIYRLTEPNSQFSDNNKDSEDSGEVPPKKEGDSLSQDDSSTSEPSYQGGEKIIDEDLSRHPTIQVSLLEFGLETNPSSQIVSQEPVLKTEFVPKIEVKTQFRLLEPNIFKAKNEVHHCAQSDFQLNSRVLDNCQSS